VLVLPLAHHEHAVSPGQKIPGHGDRRKGRRPGREDLVARILPVQVLGRPAPINVPRTDEQNPFPGQPFFLLGGFYQRGGHPVGTLLQFADGFPSVMNVERLLREVEKRLEGYPASERAEVLDALREEIARERRHVDPSLTVEVERERRVEAETLRDILEAITRQARLEETIDEVLRQISRIIPCDFCFVALTDPEGRFRIIAARGEEEPSPSLGLIFKDPLTDLIRQSHQPVTVSDVQADDRLAPSAGTPRTRSCADVPLVVEGELIGVLRLERYQVEPFSDEDIHRAKALAFSAAAAIRKGQLLEQVRRYAALMERVVTIDQAIFAGKPAAEVARVILDGALHVGTHEAGLLILTGPDGPKIAACVGESFAGSEGRPAPPELDVKATSRILPNERHLDISPGVPLTQGLYLVPLATADVHLGTLALVDESRVVPEDHLMEAYASRAAVAYLYSTLHL